MIQFQTVSTCSLSQSKHFGNLPQAIEKISWYFYGSPIIKKTIVILQRRHEEDFNVLIGMDVDTLKVYHKGNPIEML